LLKPLEEFARDASRPAGRKSLCKACERDKSRRYYEEHREAILARAAAKRVAANPEPRTCSECDRPLERRQRVTCGSSRCREARFRRLHPEAYARREAAKVERRREKRAASRRLAAVAEEAVDDARPLPPCGVGGDEAAEKRAADEAARRGALEQSDDEAEGGAEDDGVFEPGFHGRNVSAEGCGA
jgi:hypothetical protein